MTDQQKSDPGVGDVGVPPVSQSCYEKHGEHCQYFDAAGLCAECGTISPFMAGRSVYSIATMLGWANVPPLHVLEAEIRALKARAAAGRTPPCASLTAQVEQLQRFQMDVGPCYEEGVVLSQVVDVLRDALGEAVRPAPNVEIIVNGQPVTIPAGPIREVIAAAIQKAGQIGAPIDQWVLRTREGEVIPHRLPDAMEYAVTGGQRLFLHLDVPLEAVRPVRTAWQPIDTAPKDGTTILAWDSIEHELMFWDNGYWRIDDLDEVPLQPTHWTPIPAFDIAVPDALRPVRTEGE